MRPLIALLLVGSLMGGTWWYTSFVNRIVPKPGNFQVQLADATYSLEVLRTFDATPISNTASVAPDGEDADSLSNGALLVLFKGEVLIEIDDLIPASQVIEIPLIPGMEVGKNELFIRARIEPPKAQEFHAMQVRVLKGNREITSSTFSSYPDCGLIYGTVLIEVPEE